MNRNSNYIKRAVKDHYGAIGDDFEIAPISKADIDVINEIVEICKKKSLYEVVDIMDSYKKEADDVVLQSLMEINTNLVMGDGELEDDEPRKLPYWIHFRDLEKNRFQRQNIHSFKLVDEVGKNGDMLGILINEVPDSVSNLPFHPNFMLLYQDDDYRQIDFNQLEDLNNY